MNELAFQLNRLREDCRRRRDNGTDWDCLDLVRKAKDIRDQLLPIYEERARRLVEKVVDAINLGIVGGKHWVGEKNAFAWVKNDTKFRHTVAVRETGIDSEVDDYVVVDFYVDFSDVHCRPSINLPKLLAIMEGREEVSFGDCGAVISMVGNFENHWHHVHIHLNNDRVNPKTPRRS